MTPRKCVKMNTTFITWLHILLIFGQLTIEIDSGRIMRKFREWRYRCREKFQDLRQIFKIWSKLKKQEPLDPTDSDYDQISNNIHRFMNTDSETLARGFDRIKESGGLKNPAINKLFDMFSRQMGNTSNFVKEMKKQMKYMHQDLNNRNKMN